MEEVYNPILKEGGLLWNARRSPPWILHVAEMIVLTDANNQPWRGSLPQGPRAVEATLELRGTWTMSVATT